MKNSGSAKVWWIIIILIIIVGGIWWYSSNNSSISQAPAVNQIQSVAAPSSPATISATSTQGTVVLNTTTSASLGTYLVAANGMTLYQYAKDAPGVSNCSGQCAAAWPPYTVSSGTSLEGGTGVHGAISTITRTDGTRQVTYNGVPLYFWQGDSKTTDATGQNVGGFSVVKP